MDRSGFLEDCNETTRTATLTPVASRDDLNEFNSVWTPAIIIRLSVVSLLMLLTLLGNVTVIVTIVSCAELRKKRVNIFILNLAIGDLLVCFVAMPNHVPVLIDAFGQWEFGAVACKLAACSFIVPVAFTILLLTAMSLDRYQVIRVASVICIYSIQNKLYMRTVRSTKQHLKITLSSRDFVNMVLFGQPSKVKSTEVSPSRQAKNKHELPIRGFPFAL